MPDNLAWRVIPSRGRRAPGVSAIGRFYLLSERGFQVFTAVRGGSYSSDVPTPTRGFFVRMSSAVASCRFCDVLTFCTANAEMEGSKTKPDLTCCLLTGGQGRNRNTDTRI